MDVFIRIVIFCLFQPQFSYRFEKYHPLIFLGIPIRLKYLFLRLMTNLHVGKNRHFKTSLTEEQ